MTAETDRDLESPLPSAASQDDSARRGRGAMLAAGFVLVAAIGTMLFLAGFLVAGSVANQAGCAAPDDAFAPFCEAYDKIVEQYVDRIPDDQLVEGAIRGMFQYGVGDPYSGYMRPDDYQNSLNDLSGTFSGIGAEMAVKNLDNPDDLAGCVELSDSCALVVVAPIAGSPAEAAGVQSGDRILAIDGDPVNGLTMQDAVATVRGPAGSDVTLTVERGGESFDLTITRDQIVVPQVESNVLNGHIGYVALNGFSGDSPAQLEEALQRLLDEGADAFILDLRDNPGGYITAAQDIGSQFVESGLLFRQESSGGQVKDWEATGDGLVTDPTIPIVVLVNGGSASASEILTAALKEHGRATIIGQPTYGKNTVQVWSELSNGGGVRITISRWFTPDHHSVAPDGIQPDIVIEEPTQPTPGEDPLLDKAVEFLSNQTSQALRAVA